MKILVVGAGPSGLCTAKELLEFDHDVTLVEASNSIGGVFAHSYKGLRLVNNNMLIAFSSYFEGLTSSDLSMWDAEKYVEYLERYAEKFDVHSRIRFLTKAVKVDRDGSGWTVKLDKQGEVSQEQYDYVVVCTGVHSTPDQPMLPKQECFKGKLIHGDKVKNPEAFKDKNVVLVGAGEYGSDLSYLIGKHAKSLTVSVRRWPGYVIPRYHDDKTTDLDTSRLHHSLPKDLSFSIFTPLLKMKQNIEFNLIRSPKDQAIQKEADRLNLACRDGNVFQRITSKTESLVKATLELGVKLKPQIIEVRENSVLFSDGSEVECDYIICCTGYKSTFPFIDQNIQAKAQNIRGMAHYMLPLNEAGIAFVGFIRPGVGSIPPMAEMQARYLAQLVSGIKDMPDMARMKRIVNMQEERDLKTFPFDAERLTGLTSYLDFMSQLSKEVGCSPKLFPMLLTSPKLFFKVMCAFMCSAQFRIHGPGANASEASRIMKSLPTVSGKILAIEWFLYLISLPSSKFRRYFQN
ncbi:flavin-containing monooxygenase [Thalassomonas haliotis]|uniref:NAD(P)-binding domain-containing protein n=1 Tax=Thalassomonas haliotis TaxID=485448 RepID=A0ABY7VH53_9GAMM|nr:NAD(P)-binding domain-containing protein [Thalassomonas haliotis]WDE11997.1 NAD(P)-binding domain-containing protein [Thalassomonas haliotis]